MKSKQITRSYHNLDHIPEYKIWAGIVQRCCNPNCSHFNNYGGRGITMDKKWRQSFVAFISDMGRRPNKQYTIDRIDNDGPYSPENCRWATRREQSRNNRRNKWVTHNGEKITITDLARKFDACPSTLMDRLGKGFSLEFAVAKRTKISNRTMFVTVNGEKMTTSDAAMKFGINRTTIRTRLLSGWSDERAVLEKPGKYYHRKQKKISA